MRTAVDAGQAHRLGRAGGGGHCGRGALADGASPAPRTGLPLLSGADAAGALVRARAAGGGLCPGAVDSFAVLHLGQIDADSFDVVQGTSPSTGVEIDLSASQSWNSDAVGWK